VNCERLFINLTAENIKAAYAHQGSEKQTSGINGRQRRAIFRDKAGGFIAIPPVPDDALIIVPMRGTVLFPQNVSPLVIGRKPSVAAVQQAVRSRNRSACSCSGVTWMKNPALTISIQSYCGGNFTLLNRS